VPLDGQGEGMAAHLHGFDHSVGRNGDGPQTVAQALAGLAVQPVEGDQTLAIILSKAFLLAADKAIKDPTILRQIRR
jgi:hypothetical protein